MKDVATQAADMVEGDEAEYAHNDILVLSDDIRSSSGFATNGRHVCWSLAEKWNVANISPQTTKHTTTTVRGRGVDILASPTERQGHSIGGGNMYDILEKVDPDLVISVIDPHMCQYLARHRIPQKMEINLRQMGNDIDPVETIQQVDEALQNVPDEPSFEWIAQIPIDTHPAPVYFGDFIEEVDYPLTMSKYGQWVFKRQFNKDVPYIYHAADTMEVQEQETDTFRLGTVNENQFRKQYPRLIRAWAQFYQKVGQPDDVEFYIHAQRQQQMHGWDLDKQLRKFGIYHKTLPYEGKVDRERLMELYNSFDVFCSATGGEGFGLTTAEAMSQECPVVITDYTTSEELVMEGEPSPRGSLVEPVTMYDDNPNYVGVERALVDIEEFADTLVEYYNDRERVRQEGRNARQWVEENLDYEDLGQEWVDFVQDTVGLEPTK